jgi:large subunit ribosomal protein L34
MAITFKKKQGKRKKTHGFLVRSKTKNGRAVLLRRRRKGREKLSV